EVSGEDAWARVRADIESYAPRELLFPRSLEPLVREAYANTAAREATLPLSEESPSPCVDAEDAAAPVARITPAAHDAAASHGAALALTPQEDWLWEPTSCASLLLEQFGARTLEGYG